MNFQSSSYFFGLFKQREKALHTGLADWAGLLMWRWRGVRVATESVLMGHPHKAFRPI